MPIRKGCRLILISWIIVRMNIGHTRSFHTVPGSLRKYCSLRYNIKTKFNCQNQALPTDNNDDKTAIFRKSIISEMKINDKEFFIKRDDLLNIDGLNGNKARKLFFLTQELNKPKQIISYGGAQSNSMFALSVFANKMNIDFVYFTSILPKFLKSSPNGNFASALKLGMKHIELTKDEYNLLYETQEIPKSHSNMTNENGQFCLIPQGVHMAEAEIGIKELAREILDFIVFKSGECNKKWKVFLESGTGTTGLFLARNIKLLHLKDLKYQKIQKFDIEVMTVSCLMSDDDLMEEMKLFDKMTGDFGFFPKIVKKIRENQFASPSKEYLKTWSYMNKNTKIDFDLIYSPILWETLLSNWDDYRDFGLIYIHSGGIEGNESQLCRYRFKKLI